MQRRRRRPRPRITLGGPAVFAPSARKPIIELDRGARPALGSPVVACSRKTPAGQLPGEGPLNASPRVPGVERPAGQGDMRSGGAARVAPLEY